MRPRERRGTASPAAHGLEDALHFQANTGEKEHCIPQESMGEKGHYITGSPWEKSGTASLEDHGRRGAPHPQESMGEKGHYIPGNPREKSGTASSGDKGRRASLHPQRTAGQKGTASPGFYGRGGSPSTAGKTRHEVFCSPRV
ncbi:hypothetical protein NDU88_001146 [Pleurodeles waltl]|uniref:Uncharacterized protein n=1 Tax=Pleurodeles waltl TaxID=8319 RepID=A0AAV7S787_PLEWA|nr:hypothetical protein NDU88_001146 [Pleurodeles waltl]